MTTAEATPRRGQWIFVHVLAILTAATTVMYVWLPAKFDLTAPNPPIPPNVARFVLLGTVAMIWFWIRMMAACVRERPARHAVVWGWVLLLGFMLGALAYFLARWRPAHRPA